MYCKFCGNEIADGERYCPRCGGITADTETTATESYEAELVTEPACSEETESAAKKSLVLGILGLAFGSIVGFILALIGKGQAKKYAELNGGKLDGKAKVGNILCTIGIPYGILSFIYQIVSIVAAVTAFLESGII